MQDVTRPWHYWAENVNYYYSAICKSLIEEGTETAPRGKRTKEIHPTTALIQDPRKRIVSCYGRVLNLPFALVEAIHIITGQNDAQALRYYNSAIIDIQGDGPRGTPGWQSNVYRFNAAYGERLRDYEVGGRIFDPSGGIDQLKHVIETLRHDPDSRQASIVLSHPYWDNYERQTNDRACNVYAHAMLRNGKLDWMQIIRSNDAIWGIPYNVVQWSHVQEWVAASLDVQMGHMFMVQDSFHVYEDMYEECKAVQYFDVYKYLDIVPLRMEASPSIAEELMYAERDVRSGLPYDKQNLRTLEGKVGPYWRAVIETLLSYQEFKKGNDTAALDKLTDYAEFRAPMLRNFCHWRWNKDKKYADLVQEAHLELSSYGIPHEEALRWLGTGRSPSSI